MAVLAVAVVGVAVVAVGAFVVGAAGAGARRFVVAGRRSTGSLRGRKPNTLIAQQIDARYLLPTRDTCARVASVVAASSASFLFASSFRSQLFRFAVSARLRCSVSSTFARNRISTLRRAHELVVFESLTFARAFRKLQLCYYSQL